MSIVQVIPRLVSVYISSEEDPAHTLASCQVFIYGPRGYMFSIIGKEFLKNMEGVIDQLKEQGVKSLEGPMVLPVGKACKRVLSAAKYEVSLSEEPEDFGNGIDMYYFKVEF